MKHSKQAEESMSDMDSMLNDHTAMSDIETLHKAHKIMKNKKHMKKLHAHAAEKMEAISGMLDKESPEEGKEEENVSSIKDIRRKANSKAKNVYE